jgi:hypothetical protein
MSLSFLNYRVWIGLSGLALGAVMRWERFIEDLESRAPGLGPVLSWDETATSALVVVTTADATMAAAARRAVDAVTRSLERKDVDDVYPANIEVTQVRR